MSLYQRKNSPVWWYDITGPDGTRHRGSTKMRDKKVAALVEKRERRRIETEHQAKKQWPGDHQQLHEAVDLFLLEKAGMDVAPEYRRQLDWWMERLGATRPVSQITRRDIMIGAAEKVRDSSRATANRYLSALRACLNYACKTLEWIEAVPEFCMYSEPAGRTRWLKREEIARLIECLPGHLRAPAVLALATGLRRSVVLGLRWEQIDLERKVISIAGDEMKNGQNHSIPLSEIAVQTILSQAGKHPDRVFTYNGQPFDRFSSKTWALALNEAGISDLRWHDLRHTWATMLAQSGVPDSILMTLGCWKSDKMVRRYAHHNVESVRQYAVAVDTMFNSATTPESVHA